MLAAEQACLLPSCCVFGRWLNVSRSKQCGLSCCAGAGAPNVIPDQVQLSGTIRALTNKGFGKLRSRVVEVSRHSPVGSPVQLLATSLDIRKLTCYQPSIAHHLRIKDL